MSIYNTPLEERFGEKLEELREGKNMTREQLAEQVGLTARHIAALERGERRPTLNTMEKLLRTLGAPTEWLVYPEFEDQNARLREISHLAATFSDEQQEFLLGIFCAIILAPPNFVVSCGLRCRPPTGARPPRAL